MTDIATINIQPYGYRRSQFAADVPRFSAAAAASATKFVDVNSIRAAAKSLLPIYATIENILGNDTRSCCTSSAAHKIQAIFDCGRPRVWRQSTLSDVLWTYSQTTSPPFDPATGANDNGAEMETVLSFWQSHGLFQDGYGKIKAAQSVDATNKAEVIAALETNGVLYAGCLLPAAIENIRGTGFMWPMLGPPQQNLGHCTLIYGHNDIGVFVSTWGMEGTITWEAFAFYFGGATGEVYTVVAA